MTHDSEETLKLDRRSRKGGFSHGDARPSLGQFDEGAECFTTMDVTRFGE